MLIRSTRFYLTFFVGCSMAFGQDTIQTPTTSSQTAPAIPIIAMMPLSGQGASAAEAQTLSDALSGQIQKHGSMRVMERSQMDQILNEQGFQQSGTCEQSECAVQAGQLLGVEQLIVGSVGKVGSTWALSVRLVKVGTGEVVRTSIGTQQGEIDQVLTELVPDAAMRLSGIEPPPRVEKPAPAPVAVESAPPPKKKSNWIWWTFGGTALAGGGTAAFLLLSNQTTPQTQVPNNETPTRTVHLSW